MRFVAMLKHRDAAALLTSHDARIGFPKVYPLIRDARKPRDRVSEGVGSLFQAAQAKLRFRSSWERPEKYSRPPGVARATRPELTDAPFSRFPPNISSDR